MTTESPQELGEVEKSKVVKGRVPVRRPDVDTLFSINPDGSRNAVHPADVKGRFQLRKQLLWYVLLGIYLAVPFVRIGGHPALLFDIQNRHFYLLGQTFNAQDVWFAFFFISGLGFALFVVASLWGRLWCGYACPQTVFLEGLFRRVERWVEGPATARAKLDEAPLSATKLVRRGLKMVVFLGLSAVITHSFLGYFMPVSELFDAVTSSPAEHTFAFSFALATTAIVFVNFTWFREQLCIVVCPYGRLQGALYDADTVVVGYDNQRGDPRGPVGSADVGDCVDCYRCVAVCPTGIDIRNGTQLECVGCANCIDACDAVMDRLERPRGLVRYDSQRGFDTGVRRFVRGRVFLYAALMLMGIAAFTIAATTRRPFEASLNRARGSSYVLNEGRVHNTFELHLINKRPAARQFRIEPIGPAAAEIVLALREVRLETLRDLRVPVHVFVSEPDFARGMKCELAVHCIEPDGTVLTKIPGAPLLGPSR